MDDTDFLERNKDCPWKVGAHVSSAGGVENAILNAAAIGCVVLPVLFWVTGFNIRLGQRQRVCAFPQEPA